MAAIEQAGALFDGNDPIGALHYLQRVSPYPAAKHSFKFQARFGLTLTEASRASTQPPAIRVVRVEGLRAPEVKWPKLDWMVEAVKSYRAALALFANPDVQAGLSRDHSAQGIADIRHAIEQEAINTRLEVANIAHALRDAQSSWRQSEAAPPALPSVHDLLAQLQGLNLSPAASTGGVGAITGQQLRAAARACNEELGEEGFAAWTLWATRQGDRAGSFSSLPLPTAAGSGGPVAEPVTIRQSQFDSLVQQTQQNIGQPNFMADLMAQIQDLTSRNANG